MIGGAWAKLKWPALAALVVAVWSLATFVGNRELWKASTDKTLEQLIKNQAELVESLKAIEKQYAKSELERRDAANLRDADSKKLDGALRQLNTLTGQMRTLTDLVAGKSHGTGPTFGTDREASAVKE